jgi:hypothetical protein
MDTIKGIQIQRFETIGRLDWVLQIFGDSDNILVIDIDASIYLTSMTMIALIMHII